MRVCGKSECGCLSPLLRELALLLLQRELQPPTLPACLCGSLWLELMAAFMPLPNLP